jgi:crossover junction endodeoxyribonuclease RusA
MTIILPLPHKRLSPNARSHWRAKAKQTKVHRHRAKVITLAALGGQPAPQIRSYTLLFYFPDLRHRDDDNAGASFKAYRDGIADALRIDDHRLTMSASPQMLADPKNPRLEVYLHP